MDDETTTTDAPDAPEEGGEAPHSESHTPKPIRAGEALREGEGGDWPRYRMVVIESGMSKNRTFYPASVLEASIELLEGKPIYVEHNEPGDMFGFEGRSMRSKVGWWSDVSFDEKETGIPSIIATANLYESSPEPWIAERIGEALRQGRPEDVGISISARGKSRYKRDDEGVYRDVTEILEYESADVVAQPSAGGRPLKIAASARKDEAVTKIEEAKSLAELLEAAPEMTLEELKEARPDLFEAAKDDTPEQEEEEETTQEEATKLNERVTPTDNDSAEVKALRENQARVDTQLAGILAAQSAQYLEQAMEAKSLPEPIREILRERVKAMKEAPAANTIDTMVDEMVKVHEASIESAPSPSDAIAVSYPGWGAPNSSVDTLDRVVASMDRFFGAEKFLSADGKTEIPESDLFQITSLKELYARLTGGDPLNPNGIVYQTGLLHEAVSATVPGANTVGFGGAAAHVPALPSAPSGLADLAGVFGISMNRAKGDIYRGQRRWWEPIVSYKDISNMKEQEYVQGDDFPVMPIRQELQDYAVVRQGDNVEKWMPAERGHMAQVSRLSIINDDLDIFRDIPMRFAKSATRTINEYVAGLFTANSGAGRALSDTKAVMHADHGANVGTAAFSRTALTTGIQVIEEQTDTAGGRLDLQASYVLIPNRLRPVAYQLLSSQLVPDSANNAVNWLNSYGIEDTIVVPNWADENNWYLMASPAQITSIQLGFLGGRRIPDFIPQTSPTEGLNYTHDVMSWKQRWDFGGDFVEYRGVYGSIVS